MVFKVMFPDLENRRFYAAVVRIEDGCIGSVERTSLDENEAVPYILPGLVDAHVHIESSMLIPSRFAEIAVQHGTVATVSDPHEIANVLGQDGVKYMIDNAGKVALKIHFTVPSCVPATDFEQSGARLNADDIDELLSLPGMAGLGEMMNYPGVIYRDEHVLKKVQVALDRGMVVDGHAPGIRGEDLKKYVGAGISTDHEAYTYEEAREKIDLGMKILIREGSAAKNFEALHSLITEHPEAVMLCSDDLHPDDLIVGHINRLIKRARLKGHDVFDLIQVASVNPVKHYGLPVGLLNPGDPADFILIDHPDQFNILSTWINGQLVYEPGQLVDLDTQAGTPNQFITELHQAEDFQVKGESGEYRVIGAVDGSLVTEQTTHRFISQKNQIMADPEQDILKIAVVNRYHQATPAVGFIRGFGLKKGAMASSVAHDSHNIIAVGTNDEDIKVVVNSLIRSKGGIALFDGVQEMVLPLPVAGIMSTEPARQVAEQYAEMSTQAIKLGSQLQAPFMTLSFMALLVIPSLKLGDRGLFDGSKFEFVSLRKDG